MLPDIIFENNNYERTIVVTYKNHKTQILYIFMLMLMQFCSKFLHFKNIV